MKNIEFLLVLAVFICATATAAPPQQDDFISGTGRQALHIPDGDAGHLDYLEELERICMFLDAWQVKDPEDPEFGGMIEDEFRSGDDRIVQSDNTQEAVYVWSRRKELTGDGSYLQNIHDAWVYLDAFPAWEEESDYYRVWNCGWGIRCTIMYESAFETTAKRSYADQCAAHIIAHAGELSFDINPPGAGVRNVLTVAWAAWNLHHYGVTYSDNDAVDASFTLAQAVKTWIEEDADNLHKVAWALSGGVAATCVLEVYFHQQPDGMDAWIDTYLSDLITYYDPDDFSDGAWLNAWNSWQALAQNALWRVTSKFHHRRISFEQSDYLRNQDTDQDGGIPAHPEHSSDEDHSWVSTYIVLMGFGALEEPPWLGLNMTDTELTAGDTFLAELELCGPGLDREVEIMIAVEIGGMFYFFPFTGPPGVRIVLDVPLDWKLSEVTGTAPEWTPFMEIPAWPDGIDPFQAVWWGAMLDPDVTMLLREPVQLPWRAE